jgi:hypothetical protein
MTSPGLHFIQQSPIELERESNPKSREWEPPLDFYHNLSSKHSITNGKPPSDGVNKGNQEGCS